MQVIRPCLVPAILILCAMAPASAEVRVSSGVVPPILEQAELPAGVTAVAVSPDGARLVFAGPSTKEGFSDLVRLEAGSQPGAPVSVPGDIRDLVFLDDGRTVVGLQYRPAKKRQGNTFLFSWAGESKVTRIMRVPPSSNDLDRWPGGDALLLACRNEIRTFLPPDFRSGPLFSLPGDNFAVSSLGSSTYVVVGKAEGLVLLDLAVPSGRFSMPVLAGLRTPGRVAALADDAEGDEVLVRLDDGSVFRATFDPLELKPDGTASHLVGLAKASRGPVLPFAPAVADAPLEEPEVLVAEIHEEPAPEAPAVEPSRPPAPVPPPPPTRSADAPRERPAPQQEESREEPEKPALKAEPPDLEPPAPVAPTRQLEGRIVGQVEMVEAVVLLGPDNILREAARVRPSKDGSWSADGLPPGRYRIQLDGGGDRVLVAEPRFLMVDVGETPTRAPEIRAVRSF